MPEFAKVLLRAMSADLVLPFAQTMIGVVALASIFYAALQARLQQDATQQEATRREAERQERAFLTTSAMYTDWLNLCYEHRDLAIGSWALANSGRPSEDGLVRSAECPVPDRSAEGLIFENLFLMIEAAYVMYNSPVGGGGPSNDSDFRSRQWGGWWAWVQELAEDPAIDLAGWWFALGNADTYDSQFAALMRTDLERGRMVQVARQLIRDEIADSEWATVARLVALTYPGETEPGTEVMDSIRRRHGAGDLTVLTARNAATEILAVAIVELHDTEQLAYLWSLAVAEDSQGVGIGGMLFDEVAELAESRGYVGTFLEVSAPAHTDPDACNDCRRIGFYNRHGCEVLPTRVGSFA